MRPSRQTTQEEVEEAQRRAAGALQAVGQTSRVEEHNAERVDRRREGQEGSGKRQRRWEDRREGAHNYPRAGTHSFLFLRMGPHNHNLLRAGAGRTVVEEVDRTERHRELDPEEPRTRTGTGAAGQIVGRVAGHIDPEEFAGHIDPEVCHRKEPADLGSRSSLRSEDNDSASALTRCTSTC